MGRGWGVQQHGCVEAQMIGLNVGSGQRRFTSTPEIEWINIDKVSRPGHEPDLVCDGAHLPYEDNSVDYVVLHHVLEHFGCGEAKNLIDEAFRVLRLKGKLIVCVPDIAALAHRWLEGNRGISTQIFMTNVYGAYMGHEEDRHKWGYDTRSLSLFIVGERCWREIDHFNFRAIPGADIARDFWVLAVEATK